MTGKQWVILLAAFSISFCCCGSLMALELQGITHMMDDEATVDLVPGATIVNDLASAYGQGIGHRIAQLIMPVALVVTGFLGVAILIGAIAEAAKRL